MDKIRKEVEERFMKDFNLIPLSLLEKAYPKGKLYKSIHYPENFVDDKNNPLYPHWKRLFEAGFEFLSERLKQHVNELAEIGIYLMKVDEANVMLFTRGARYDFESYWIPMYTKVLKWI